MTITQQRIITAFADVQLAGARTLLECDFYDTHYRYFDEVDDQYLTAVENSAEDLLLKYGFDWPEHYMSLGLTALKNRARPDEQIKFWTEVDHEYLYYFGGECCFLDSEGFRFFLPAAMSRFLDAGEKNTTFIDHFINRLDLKWGKDAAYFNNEQKAVIAEFVQQYFPREVSWTFGYRT